MSILLSMIKNLSTSVFVDCFVIKNVDIEYPIASEKSKAKMRSDFTPNIYRSRNHIPGNLLAALILRQKPKLHRRDPKKK